MYRISNLATPIVGVLDIETRLDPVAAALVGGPVTGAAGKAALHGVKAATLLTAHADGKAIEVRFRSWYVDQIGEDELLTAIDAGLAVLRNEDARLVTFNGRRHDLPVLRRRLARHMLFDRRGVWRWLEPEAPHVDLMTDLQPSSGKWSSLREEAAGLGIAMPTSPSAREAAAAARQSEIDCATTYLVYLHLCAGAVGKGAPLISGWQGLAAAIDRDPALLHLRSLAKPASLATLF